VPIPRRVTSSRPKYEKEEVGAEQSRHKHAETDGGDGGVDKVVVEFGRGGVGGLFDVSLMEVVLAQCIGRCTL
jgi:hypothetical protein